MLLGLKTTLPLFFKNLNSLLGKLNFNKFNGLVLKDLDTLLEHLDLMNRELLNPIGTKVTLYVFDN